MKDRITRFLSLGARSLAPVNHASTPPGTKSWFEVTVGLFWPFKSVFCQVPRRITFLFISSRG